MPRGFCGNGSKGLLLPRSAHCASYGNLSLARVANPRHRRQANKWHGPVKLCNAPATNLTIGSDQAFEPRPAAAEVASCPYDRNLLLDNPRFCGARANAVGSVKKTIHLDAGILAAIKNEASHVNFG
jgi:hypothetical protein